MAGQGLKTGKTGKDMAREILMGNEAIGLGAIRAGVNVVTGYPGTPSTEILETIAKRNDGSIYVEWSINEKSALEIAAGAAYAGARALVTMKQVGLNVASDPLMSLAYVGIKGGMVVVVAEDPGPISSQTEQDTRHFAHFAKLPLFDPSTPEEAYRMIADAFELSERYGTPVLFRPTTRVCHSYASVDLREALPRRKPEGFVKDSKWVIFPRLAYLNHKKMEANLVAMRGEMGAYEGNKVTGSGRKGIAAGGVSAAYVREALESCAHLSEEYKLFEVATYPLPYGLARFFLDGLDEVLVVEELDPVIEKELTYLCGLDHRRVTIRGKLTGTMPNAGEYTVDGVLEAVRAFLKPETSGALPAAAPFSERERQVLDLDLPVRPPVLCAGCPHRASFFAVKEATKKRKAVYSGDIGCYTLGNALPLDMVDTCLCMGAGITVAQGLQRVEPDVAHFAFIGDSTFFHSGITGVLNAVYNQTDIIVVILDNGTTAMTGNQPHPGTGRTMMGTVSGKFDIPKLMEALGVSVCVRVNPFEVEASQAAVKSVLDVPGVRVILFEAPCIVLGTSGETYTVDLSLCSGCRLCLKKLGCPALGLEADKARIDPGLCTGCAVCAKICPTGAIVVQTGAAPGAVPGAVRKKGGQAK